MEEEQHSHDCIVPQCTEEILAFCMSLIQKHGGDPDTILNVMTAMERVTAAFNAAAMHSMVEDSDAKLDDMVKAASGQYQQNIRHYYTHPAMHIVLTPTPIGEA